MRAVITGATSGIGMELAKILSQRGWSLILTGRNQAVLEELQKNLSTEVEIIALDLAQPNAPFALYDFCKGKKVDLLVNNAGFGIFGSFSQTDLETELQMIQVNVRALHILTKLFLKDFKKRNSGRILNVASSAGFLTGPLMSTYYASKNYVVRLSLAIAEELRREKSHVTISILCPGPVDTNFNKNAGGGSFAFPPLSAERVAKEAIYGTLTGKKIIIPGWFTQLGVRASKLVPEEILSRVVYHIQKVKKD